MLRLLAPVLLAVLIGLKFAFAWDVDATFVAATALIVFLGAMVEFKVPEMLAGALDTRSEEIGKELAEAKKLRAQAAALLAEYEAKKLAAEAQAAEIVAHAKEQADALAAEAKTALADSLARHERAATEKIARAEAQALTDVRAAAVDAAVQAAEQLLKAQLNNAAQEKLVERGVADVQRAFSA